MNDKCTCGVCRDCVDRGIERSRQLRLLRQAHRENMQKLGTFLQNLHQDEEYARTAREIYAGQPIISPSKRPERSDAIDKIDEHLISKCNNVEDILKL